MKRKKLNPILSSKWLVFTTTAIVFIVTLALFYYTTYITNYTDIHVDFDNAITYVREGFDPAQLLSPNLGDGTWTRIEGGIGGVEKTGLMDQYKTSFLTLKDTEAVTFTYVIKLYVPLETKVQMRHLAIIPAFYFSAIGDNWAVYLNGDLLQSEISLDEDGQIIDHRRQRRVVIPFNNSSLQAGENLLVVKVIGPGNYEEMGLSASGAYYIDEFMTVERANDDLLFSVIIGFCILLVLHNGLLYMRTPKEKANLYFAILALMIAIHTAMKIPIAQYWWSDTATLMRVKYISLLGLAIPLTLFLAEVAQRKLSILQKVVIIVNGTLCVLILFAGSQFTKDALKVGHIMIIATLVYGTLVLCNDTARKIKELMVEREISVAQAVEIVGVGTLSTDLIFGALIACVGMIQNRIANGDSIENITLWLFAIVLSMTFAINDDHIRSKLIADRENEKLEDIINLRTHELAHQVQVANAANESKSKFLATMSHEIRTPLNAILGIADIELLNEKLPNTTQESLGKLQTAAYSLLGLINDILDLSKIEMGKIEVAPDEYNVMSLINDVAQLNMVRLEKKDVKFYMSVSPDMPENLYGDELRVKQIFNNILSNAFKYTDKGTVNMEIYSEEVPGQKDKIYFVFCVEDSGQGMKPDDVAALFEEYRRFNNEENQGTEGTGLGMSITKSLVQLMNGDIDVQSEYGVGSTFTIRLQQKLVDDLLIGEERAKELQNFNYAMDRTLRKKNVVYNNMEYARVLIVDDVDTNLFVARGLLNPYKLQIDTVTNGPDAIERVLSGAGYDIVFMDQMMPEMDGIETTARIRETGYTKPIVALTANAISGNAETLMQLGFDGFLSKPIDTEKMDVVLKKFIAQQAPEGFVAPVKVADAQDDTQEQLMRVFRRDAKKAQVTLKETFEKDDLQLFTISAHAMKSALANIGQEDLSDLARLLEQAGNEKDKGYIAANLSEFLLKLQVFTVDEEPRAEAQVDEDTQYLQSHLDTIKSAAKDYDGDVAEAALRELDLEKWSNDTLEMLESLSEMVLHSDFDEIVAMLEAVEDNED